MNDAAFFARWTVLIGLCLAFLSPPSVLAEAPSAEAIPFTQETLPNGLRVIYAPLHQAPVVHVRVLYHVGSRDERPDRQGFAHMFEHMMFRGSAHVPPQEHMKLINQVGGYSNAFTSFDETVYVNTVPSEHLEMALYLEADRMSSFKVSDEIYRTERKVVAEEWGMKQNRPYGNLYEDYLKLAFTRHSYRWTPIGNMQHLAAAPVSELQDFFNTYYLPNNAVLVIAGDIDVDAAKQMVQKYFAWIPRGADIHRLAEQEPPQTEPRQGTVPDRVPLTEIVVGWHMPAYKSDDQYPLSVLSAALGEGASSRLERLLVSSEHPLCDEAGSIDYNLEDGGIFGVSGRVMPGKDAAEVEKILKQSIADVLSQGITTDELAKAKTLRRVEMIQGRQKAEDIATQLGEEELFGDDAGRVNRDLAKLDAVTAADVQAAAVKYLQPNGATTLRMVPDPLGLQARKAAATMTAALSKPDAPVAPSTQPVTAREVHFPANYPEHPPIALPRSAATFEKGTEAAVNGVRVVVMPDHRLPLVSWSLAIRRGSHSDPAGKEGLAGLTAGMLRRGAGNLTEQQLSEELESHGISLGIDDGGDVTTLKGSSTTEELDRGFARSRDLLLAPTFAPEEFDKLKEQTLSVLTAAQDNPGTVADQDLLRALFGGSPLGHPATPASVATITLDDVKQFYAHIYHPNDAILIISGDVTVKRGQELAKQLTDGWQPQDLPPVDYTMPPASTARKIILVDGPPGRGGAVIRLGLRAYDIHTDDKFAGSLASTILSSGIESRLGLYVRAKKGYVYGVIGIFQPGRHAGAFMGNTETKLATTADTIEAMFKVFDDLRKELIAPEELDAAKRRVAGSLVMTMQTIADQARLRSDGILNGYPIDYYDRYAERISSVTADQIRDVMNKYVDNNAMTVIVVAPASEVKNQLQRLGNVEVIPMPAQRGTNPSTKPGTPDLLKPAT